MKPGLKSPVETYAQDCLYPHLRDTEPAVIIKGHAQPFKDFWKIFRRTSLTIELGCTRKG